MNGRTAIGGRKAGAAALALLLALATSAAPADARVKRLSGKPATARGFGTFTPAAADPRLAAAVARTGVARGANANGFHFTPSGSSNSRRAITVAVRARLVTRAEAAKALSVASATAPYSYNAGVSVGWKRFALSGDVIKADAGLLLPDSRESADIGLSFSGRRWATKVDLAADRNSGRLPALIGLDQSVSVGLGGSYALTHNLDVTGGVRYKVQRDQLMRLSDTLRDSQAVFLGTTFRF